MSHRTQLALELFNTSYNCAQSVLLPFSQKLNISKDILEKIACGFGGGMGRLQKTCGAVTGAFMVISLYTSNSMPDHDECTDLLRARIMKFHKRFIEIHEYSDCRDLLGYDINTEEGRNKINEKNLKENICIPCVNTAVRILERMLNSSLLFV